MFNMFNVSKWGKLLITARCKCSKNICALFWKESICSYVQLNTQNNGWIHGLLFGLLVEWLVPMGSRCRTASPTGDNDYFQFMLSIHLHLSNAVKNPCSKTNWHSSVAYCDETVTGIDCSEDNPTKFSHPKPKRRPGMDSDWSGNKWLQIVPVCTLAWERLT